MCLGSSPPAPEAPAPAPAPPADGPAAPVVNETTLSARNSNDAYSANRRGRNSLRIDMDPAAGQKSGLNIPQ